MKVPYMAVIGKREAGGEHARNPRGARRGKKQEVVALDAFVARA